MLWEELEPLVEVPEDPEGRPGDVVPLGPEKIDREEVALDVPGVLVPRLDVGGKVRVLVFPLDPAELVLEGDEGDGQIPVLLGELRVQLVRVLEGSRLQIVVPVPARPGFLRPSEDGVRHRLSFLDAQILHGGSDHRHIGRERRVAAVVVAAAVVVVVVVAVIVTASVTDAAGAVAQTKHLSVREGEKAADGHPFGQRNDIRLVRIRFRTRAREVWRHGGKKLSKTQQNETKKR